MKTRNIVTVIVAAIGGAYTLSQFGTSTFGIMSSLNVAVIIGVAGISNGKVIDAQDDKSKGYVVQDELTLMVERRASSIAFRAGNFVWLALMWTEFNDGRWMPLPSFGSPAVIILGLMVNLGIYFASLVYYRNRK